MWDGVWWVLGVVWGGIGWGRVGWHGKGWGEVWEGVGMRCRGCVWGGTSAEPTIIGLVGFFYKSRVCFFNSVRCCTQFSSFNDLMFFLETGNILVLYFFIRILRNLCETVSSQLYEDNQ